MNSGPKQELWTRHFIIICLVNLLCFLSFHMQMVVFPFFIIHLGGDRVLAGLTAGLFSIAALLFRPLAGWALDNAGRRAPVFWGMAGMFVLTLVYARAYWLVVIVLLRIAHGIFWSFTSTGIITNASDHVPRARFAEGMGYFGITMTVSMAIAPALGLYIKNNFGFGALFFCSAGIALGAFAMTFIICFKPLPAQEKRPLAQIIGGLFEKTALPASVTILFFLIPYGAVHTFIALYADESGIGSGGLYFAIIAISSIIVRILGGQIADKIGERPIIYLGVISLILAMLLLVLIKTMPAFLLSSLVFGIGFGGMPPAMQAFAMRKARPEKRGAASSTYLCAFDIGIGLGGIISGFLVEYLGYTTMFATMIIPVICCLLIYVLWAGKSEAAFKKQAPGA